MPSVLPSSAAAPCPLARDGHAQSGGGAGRDADAQLGFAAGAFKLVYVLGIHQPLPMHAQEGPAEGSLDGGEREVDVEPPARGMDVSEAFGRLERPHFLEANEDQRPLPAGDDARWRARGVRLQPGLHVHVTAPDGLRMRDPRPALTVLRCAQEIVTNAVLHARAQNLWLELSQHDGVLSLSARDDGRGASELGGEASAQRACTFQVNRRLSPRREWAVANDDHFWIPADTGFVADRPRDVLH